MIRKCIGSPEEPAEPDRVGKGHMEIGGMLRGELWTKEVQKRDA